MGYRKIIDILQTVAIKGNCEIADQIITWGYRFYESHLIMAITHHNVDFIKKILPIVRKHNTYLGYKVLNAALLTSNDIIRQLIM